jgi:glycosyltransferase involved in cell wall biosynthesis
MRILHLAAGNRWTGAAAPAFAEVEALRAAGVDAHYAYVGGYKLEAKLAHHDFAHPLIAKAQNPFSFNRTLAHLERLIARHRFDVIHAHLTYDHWLARFVGRDVGARIARTFHAHRVLRRDPFSRSLFNRTDLLFVVNASFANHPAFGGRIATFTPPPLDLAQFTPAGPDVRALYGFTRDEKIVTVIGKVAPGRGWEDALATFAVLRNLRSDVRMMIIGHGPHRPHLEALAQELGITPHVTWAGYHEDDLAEHYRASDVLLFTARGSDEGHRAVLEALACGVPVASFPIAGVDALLPPAMISAEPTPASLASCASAVLDASLREVAIAQAQEFGYARAAERLIQGYSR